MLIARGPSVFVQNDCRERKARESRLGVTFGQTPASGIEVDHATAFDLACQNLGPQAWQIGE